MIKLILNNINQTTEIYFEDQEKAEAWIASELDSWKSFNQPIAEQFSITSSEVGFEPYWIAFRQKRDAALSACDYTQLADAPFTATVKGYYKQYRSYLRSLPSEHENEDPRNLKIMSYEEWMELP